ncbi:class II aldolase/adducin family protein [Thermoplasma volcanium]|nr:class II aldolase/adducin family protein [Thermoplasma volcanium]
MYEKEKEQVVEACRRIAQDGLTVGSWGNISVRADDGKIAITPSGKNYNKTEKEDIVITSIDGDILEGHLTPSSERLMHYEIYRKRSDVKAIVHTHSVYSSILSVVDDDLPAITEDVIMILGRSVRVAKYAMTGTVDLAKNVVEALGDSNATIMKNHGAVAVGKDIDRAMAAAYVLEKSAKIYVMAKLLGKVSAVPDDDVDKLIGISEAYLKQWDRWKK